MTRSPLLTSINSIISGIVTIRCLDLHHKFLKETQEAAHLNMKAVVAYHILLRYITASMDAAYGAVLGINVLSLVALKGTIDSEYAAVTLAVGASLYATASYTIKCIL